MRQPVAVVWLVFWTILCLIAGAQLGQYSVKRLPCAKPLVVERL